MEREDGPAPPWGRWPELLDASRDEAPVALTPERAEAIYRARSGDPDRDLRTHIVELLNYGEYVAVSYSKGVAERSRDGTISFGRTSSRPRSTGGSTPGSR